MASKTGTVCAGVTQNGYGDAVAFAKALKKKGYDGVPYGKDTPASEANFKSGRSRTVMYWTGHGYMSSTDYK